MRPAHLPDERTLRHFVSTHPFGGLTFIYEDVTTSWRSSGCTTR